MTAGKGIGILGAALLASLVIAAPSTAVDSDLKFGYAFKVKASNGYSVWAYAGNERADGRGAITLFVQRRNEYATYTAPALLTATSVKADFGALGKVDLSVAPSGRKKHFQMKCNGESEAFDYEPPRYTGDFEFHGEGDYTDAASSAPSEFNRFFHLLGCLVPGGGETRGASLPGARLLLVDRRGDRRLTLRANKNRPGKRSRFEVELHEKRGKVRISRATSLWLGSEAFRFDPALSEATLAPTEPFSGRASFHRGAPAAERWSGDLSVDLPGRLDVPLAGNGMRATLIHSCWGDVRC